MYYILRRCLTMKKVLALVLTAVLCLLTLTACGGVNFESNYKVMTQEDAEELKTIMSEKLTEEGMKDILDGFRIHMETELAQFDVSMKMDALFVLKEGEVKMSGNFDFTYGETTEKMEAYYKEGWFYAVTEEEGERRVVKEEADGYDSDELFDYADIDLNALLEMTGIDFEDFDLEELTEAGFEIFYSKSFGTYKLKIVITEDAFNNLFGASLSYDDFKFEIYYVFTAKGLSGIKMDINIKLGNMTYMTVYVELTSYNGAVTFPAYLEDAIEE